MRNINLADLTISKFYGVVESVLNHDHGEFWLMGGRASLKSSVISLLIVCLIVAFPWANAVVVRRFGNTLRDSVYAQIIWAIDILGLSSFFHARVSPMEIVYVPTGQKIVFRGMDDPLKMKGVKFVKGYCAIQWFEELDQGSSPRMRGTLRPAQRLRGVLGIIPAYAGNTLQSVTHLAALRDHPRVCGEHCSLGARMAEYTGSSPRMRGTRLCDHVPPNVHGIIPAYAGNTLCSSSCHRTTRDHPRVCGEHCSSRCRAAFPTGSSPRMRGTPPGGAAHRTRSGIIPAYAGNTRRWQRIHDHEWDHPRVCGEHSETFRNIVDAAGSSPRMRGTHIV